MNAVKIMISKDGTEYQHGIYSEESAPIVVASINNSPAGQAGSVARIAEALDVKIIEPAQAHHYATELSTHRLAWRAIEAARKACCAAYAHLADGTSVRLAVHRGDIGGRACFSMRRYVIAGAEYVLCADGHFERAQTLDANGRLSSWCVSVVAAAQDSEYYDIDSAIDIAMRKTGGKYTEDYLRDLLEQGETFSINDGRDCKKYAYWIDDNACWAVSLDGSETELTEAQIEDLLA